MERVEAESSSTVNFFFFLGSAAFWALVSLSDMEKHLR
jgi:hypothetical protein